MMMARSHQLNVVQGTHHMHVGVSIPKLERNFLKHVVNTHCDQSVEDQLVSCKCRITCDRLVLQNVVCIWYSLQAMLPSLSFGSNVSWNQLYPM